MSTPIELPMHRTECRPSGIFFAHPQLTTDKAKRLAEALQKAPTEDLLRAFGNQLSALNLHGSLAAAHELTVRGIAPCFRGALQAGRNWTAPEEDRILAICDMLWVVVRYPKHEVAWQRMRGLFEPQRFHRTADFVLWNGRRAPGQIVKGLALSKQQQVECRWIRALHVARRVEGIAKRQPAIAAKIENAVRDRDKRCFDEQEVTIQRRLDLWLCAELAEWAPQRTADLYAMRTGRTLPRNLVAKQLEKIKNACRSVKNQS